jgi:hypothetical protein
MKLTHEHEQIRDTVKRRERFGCDIYTLFNMSEVSVPLVSPANALPKTPTQKVQKHQLRSDGVSADTWDREAVGLRIRRSDLS